MTDDGSGAVKAMTSNDRVELCQQIPQNDRRVSLPAVCLLVDDVSEVLYTLEQDAAVPVDRK